MVRRSVLVLVAVAILSGSSFGQCVNGTCQLRTPVRTVANAAVHVAGNTVEVAANVVGTVVHGVVCRPQETYYQQPVSYSGSGIAQHKANQQAREGRMRHVGGSMGGGRYEGVGFSSVSADDAIRRCCFWGQRTPVEIGVARGANGFFACVIYR